jgi:hypothetical protein
MMHHSSDLPGVVWRKSSRSGEQGECVEVAHVDTTHAVRDSKDPRGGFLSFDAAVWTAFMARVKRGEHDPA